MITEENDKYRKEVESYFKEHGWNFGNLREFKKRHSYFQYGASRIIKPTVRMER